MEEGEREGGSSEVSGVDELIKNQVDLITIIEISVRLYINAKRYRRRSPQSGQ